jgi:hypothetical protein
MAHGFLTVEEFKRYPMPITTKQWSEIGDDQLEAIIEYASHHLEDYMDRGILRDDYTDRLRGSNDPEILLNNYPAHYVTSVTAYDAHNNPYAYNTTNFFLDEEAGILGWLDRYRYTFYRNMYWTVTYNAGYDTVPGPIKHATALQTTKMLQPVFRGGVNFQEVELIGEIDEQIVELLDKYKKRRLG